MTNMLNKGALVLTFLLLAGTVQNASADEEAPPEALLHPRDAALLQQPNGDWTYRKSPEGDRLYVYEDDFPGESNCNRGCASAWPPLLVSPGDENVGDWTAIPRDDGREQWAYKGQPVYYRIHDLPQSPEQLQEAGFRPLEP